MLFYKEHARLSMLFAPMRRNLGPSESRLDELSNVSWFYGGRMAFMICLINIWGDHKCSYRALDRNFCIASASHPYAA